MSLQISHLIILATVHKEISLWDDEIKRFHIWFCKAVKSAFQALINQKEGVMSVDPAVIAKAEADIKAAVGFVEGTKITNADDALKLVDQLLVAAQQLKTDAGDALAGPDRVSVIVNVVCDCVSIPDCPPFLEKIGLTVALNLLDKLLTSKLGADWVTKLEALAAKVA